MLRPAPRTHTRTHVLALTLTHTRTHAHAAGPRAHRPAAATRITIATPRFFFFFFNFNLPLLGFPTPNPPAPRKANTSPGRIFPELLGPPAGRREGSPALLLRPGCLRERIPGPSELRPGPGCPAGRGCGQRPSAPACAVIHALPGPRPRPGLASAALVLLPAGRKFTLCSGLNLERGGELPALHLPSSPALPLLLGPRRGMGCLWEFGVPRRWEPVLGRPCLTRGGRGRVGECSLLSGAPQTECRRMGASVGVRLSHLIPASLLPTHAHSAPPRNL